ncbi:hypothetical protein APE_0275.1 [Aeropyrum pernix K1]|uniref:DNA-3-methyladenine glycosylase II n=1 Tax=Aeropyrum pernix (strain ATCC 700893 / DSM 11879 / JCM 9820 / NBRC 100138 / K1) TaxID=272557 RepID=Q9YFG9_AERPE|nr:hypothetical protein APE_0275.1 [Aeropyrum pernix K1]
MKAALRIQSRLITSYGEHVSIGREVFYSFPDPERLISLSLDRLRRIGLTRMKAQAIKNIAMTEYEGRLPSVEEIEQAEELSSIVKELTRLKGVGPWTAELAIAQVHPLFPLGPRTDLAVRRGFKNYWGYRMRP